jgi:two-component system LytT family response regulator
MSMLRALIVDDEAPARARVARLLSEDARCVLAGEARHGLEALERISALAPDVLILDVQMPGLDGFEVLEALGPDHGMGLVFSTAHDEHALRAFEAHAVDYLVKPYTEARFRKAIDKAIAQRAFAVRSPDARALLDQGRAQTRSQLAIKTADGPWVCVQLDDILRVSAANKHVSLVLEGREHIVRMPLRELLTRLDARFVRVHRSELLNVDAVARYEAAGHGDMIVTLRDGSVRRVARRCREHFMAGMRARY